MKNWQTATEQWQWRITRADFLSLKTKKKKKKHGCTAQRFTSFFPLLLNIPTSATLLFTPKSPSSFLCSVRPDWSGVIDEEHWFGRASITLLVIRTSWINDRREGGVIEPLSLGQSLSDEEERIRRGKEKWENGRRHEGTIEKRKREK